MILKNKKLLLLTSLLILSRLQQYIQNLASDLVKNVFPEEKTKK